MAASPPRVLLRGSGSLSQTSAPAPPKKNFPSSHGSVFVEGSLLVNCPSGRAGLAASFPTVARSAFFSVGRAYTSFLKL